MATVHGLWRQTPHTHGQPRRLRLATMLAYWTTRPEAYRCGQFTTDNSHWWRRMSRLSTAYDRT